MKNENKTENIFFSIFQCIAENHLAFIFSRLKVLSICWRKKKRMRSIYTNIRRTTKMQEKVFNKSFRRKIYKISSLLSLLYLKIDIKT